MKKGRVKTGTGLLLLAIFFLTGTCLNSCRDDFPIEISPGEPVSLSVSDTELVLCQKTSGKTALSFYWTRGSNGGTGSSISYVFQVDLVGKDFASALSFDMGKGVFEKSFTGKELNDHMVESWGHDPGAEVNLEARVIAKISDAAVEDDVSEVITVAITGYVPVSKTLYFIGNAAPNGWDASRATPMVADPDDPTTFTFQGDLNAGQLKFITVLGTFFPTYGKGEDDHSLIYYPDNSLPTVNFEIAEAGKYHITMNLVDLTINIELITGPGYEVLYLFGSANPAGEDIGNGLEMFPDPDNLFKFSSNELLIPGEFFIAVNKDTDLGQNMFMRDPQDSSKVCLHACGDPDRSGWVVEEENMHSVQLNLSNYTISIEPLRLYIIGSATPVGWMISDAIPLEQDPDEWFIWRYEGPLAEGEFKFPVNRQIDWGQDMYMKDPSDPEKMYRHKGGDEDDEKWVITATEAGNYLITLNVRDLTIDIQKL